MLITLVLLSLPGTSRLETDISNIFNITSRSGTATVASTYSVNETDSKETKYHSIIRNNKTAFGEQTSFSILENVTTSIESPNTGVSFLATSKINASIQKNKTHVTKKTGCLASGNDTDAGSCETRWQKAETKLCNQIIGVTSSTSPYSDCSRRNETQSRFEEKLNCTGTFDLNQQFLPLVFDKLWTSRNSQKKRNTTLGESGHFKNETDCKQSETLISVQGVSSNQCNSLNQTNNGDSEMLPLIQVGLSNQNIFRNETDSANSQNLTQKVRLSQILCTDGPENAKSEINTLTEERLSNRNNSENEIVSDIVTRSSMDKLSLKKSGCKNKIDNDGNDILTMLQIELENDTNADGSKIAISKPEHPQNTGSFGHRQVTAPIRSGIDDDLDRALTFTCHDRCGMSISFPCSCSATCVAYDTCCDGMAKDCPRVWEEGLAKFDPIRTADVICAKDSIYIISSCPNSVKKRIRQEEIETIDVKETIAMNENLSLSSDGVTPGARETTSTNSSGSHRNFPGSIVEKLYRALSLAPVTDSDTGFTFVNRGIYNCHNVSKGIALTWSLKLHYNFTSPTGLADFDRNKDLNEYRPDFSRRILKAHLCVQNLVETCDKTEVLEQQNEINVNKCQSSHAILTLRQYDLPRIFYRNKFCAYCNDGRQEKYQLYSANKFDYRGPEFHVLMSVSKTNTFSFRLKKPTFTPENVKLPWSHATCSIPVSSESPGTVADSVTLESESRAECSVTCEHPSFKLRSDGHCKAEHAALIAISDDGLPPLCYSARTKLAKFFECGLANEVESLKNADLRSTLVSVVFDASTSKRLYVLELHMDFPEPSVYVFSNSQKDVFINLQHVSLLAKSFKDYRQSHNLCPEEDEVNQNGIRVIHTLPLFTLVNILVLKSIPFDQGMEQLRGPVVDNGTTTTVCVTSVIGLHDLSTDPNRLKCMNDSEYERDNAWLSKFQSSNCFSHLKNIQSAGNNGSNGVVGYRGILLRLLLVLMVQAVILV
ncbi:hypothetical protein PoB_001310400 [Plakobranchus ocellatus]|uniref:SMB domain-containing protein n=1 Tax=Plakobranchus ocellatus TaxID=259542 RepID=A0AAV3YX01_9GAST|nr:hypothetical protein PoB_001310400 [Plakobranchus ocellatus]